MLNRAHHRKRRVLVVDDEESIRATLAFVLHDLGCEVVEAEDATRALERIHARRFDLVITDFSMPGPSGVDLIRRVIEAVPEPMPVMVLYTGHDLETGSIGHFRSEIAQSGCAVYFAAKGGPLEDLQAILGAALAVPGAIG